MVNDVAPQPRAVGDGRGAQREVAIVQRSLRRYREPFYEGLRAVLADEGVRLRLLHSNPPPELDPRGDPARIAWAEHVPAGGAWAKATLPTWQPVLHRTRKSDLVIVEHALQLLANYVLVARQRLGGPRVALWGHGWAAGGESRSRAAVRRVVSRLPWWWFAYTARTAEVIAAGGFPAERITVVDNASDSAALAAAVEALDSAAVEAVRRDLGLTGSNVGLFLGNFAETKRFDVLFQGTDRVRERIGDFELLVVGGGVEDEDRIRSAARSRPWVRVLPHRFGDDLAAVLRLAKVMLVPGWVGLVAVDSFAGGVPIVTSRAFPHPPEIDYLDDNANAVILESGDAVAYGDAVAELLLDEPRRKCLVEGCRRSAARYTIEGMVDRFAAGILAALRT